MQGTSVQPDIARLRNCGFYWHVRDGCINSFDRCSIKIRTENILVARKVFTLIEKTFNIRSDISVRRNIKKQTETYSVIVKKHEDAIRILQATKMIGEQQENAEELHAVNPMIVQQVCCRRAFLRGTFQRPDL